MHLLTKFHPLRNAFPNKHCLRTVCSRSLLWIQKTSTYYALAKTYRSSLPVTGCYTHICLMYWLRTQQIKCNPGLHDGPSVRTNGFNMNSQDSEHEEKHIMLLCFAMPEWIINQASDASNYTILVIQNKVEHSCQKGSQVLSQ